MVVTFAQLGNYGRMGNALFQMATTMAHAKRVGERFLFPHWKHAGAFPLQGCYVDRLPSLKTYEEPHWHYKKIPDLKDVNLHGYFQSYKYFDDFEEFIREQLTPKDHEDYPELTNICSIHVRRGDYLKLSDFHTNLDISYYEEAMRVSGFNQFIVLSDDPDWCKKAFAKHSNVKVSEKSDQYTDFNMMISTEGHIIANSSFSWWGAWLDPNPEKVVIAPKKWFGPKNSHIILDYLFVPGWTVI